MLRWILFLFASLYNTENFCYTIYNGTGIHSKEQNI